MSESVSRISRSQVVAALASAVVVVLAAVGGAVAVWSVRDELPQVVATHWGPTGRADGFQPLSGLFVENMLMCLVMPLFILVIGVVAKQVRYLGPVAGGTAVFLSSVMNGSVWMQRGMTAEQVAAASSPDLPLVAGGLVALLVGGLLHLGLRRKPSDAAVPVEIAATAPRLLVDDAVRVAWTGRTRVARAVWVLLGAVGLVTVVPMAAMLVAGTWGGAVIMAFTVVLLVVVGAAMVANVSIDARGVRARVLGVVPLVNIPLTSISAASVTQVSPLGEFGGWGLRVGLNGEMGLVTSAGPAVRIERGSQEGPFLITLTDAEAAAATLNTLLSRRGGDADQR